MRVGTPWLHRTCGVCRYCRAGKENLCERADFTGYTVDGGYAEYIVAPGPFVYPIPDAFSDTEAAPLLCAGIIGFRSLRLSGIQPGGRLGNLRFLAPRRIWPFRWRGIGAWRCTFARATNGIESWRWRWGRNGWVKPRRSLRRNWTRRSSFAPAGELVQAALAALDKGGTLALGGIHMSTIPPLDYSLLYHERVVRSVTNNTRDDGRDFLRVAAEIPIRAQVEVFPLSEVESRRSTS